MASSHHGRKSSHKNHYENHYGYDIEIDEYSRGKHRRHAQVVVYILSAHPRSEEVRLLASLFSDPIFIVKGINIPAPVEIQGSDTLTLNQELEAYRISKVLKDASINHPDLYVITVKDTSVTNASSNDVADVVKAALDQSRWDLFYLCRWLDRCDLYRDREKVPGKNSVITRTFSPNGAQVIMFSPEGRDLVIGATLMPSGHQFPPVSKNLSTQFNIEIENGNLTAFCVVPNLFEFNVFDSEMVSDLAKVSECRRPDTSGTQQGILPFAWFLIIVVGVILLAWAFWYIGPKYNPVIN